MNNDFYEDEVIEGFYVPAMLKKAWGAQLDVLNEVDIICRRHDIPFFADWGTLLATIRHNGYIPWDDDIDISMRRKDYERFLRHAEDELPEGFKVMNYKNHPGHHFFVARIVGKPRICFEQDHLTRFHGFPYIAGIDLFVLDNVCRDRDKEHIKSVTAEFTVTVADSIADGKVDGAEAEEMLKQIESFTGRSIDRRLEGEDLRIELYALAEALFASIPDEEADALVQMMPYGMYGNKGYIPKEYYRKTVRLPYMDTTMPVPLCYDTVMRMKFGEYMHIHKTWEGHDYPFFYGQHRDLVSVLDFEYPAYKANREDVISSVSDKPDEGMPGDDVVFLPFSPKYWKYMEKLYRYCRDKGFATHVVPIPYNYKAWDGSAAEEVFDPAAYPEDIMIEDHTGIDLAAMHPKKIVIQCPFDEWNETLTVSAKYYSVNLKKYTDELIYIPFFVTDDFTKEQEREFINMDGYVTVPGVINADRVILPTEMLKKTYTDKITGFIGADDGEVLDALDRKLAGRPDLVFSDENHTGSFTGKKTLVYFTTISFLAENGKRATEKIKEVLDTFEENADRITVKWVSQCIKGNEGCLEKSVANDYREAVKRFEKAGLGEYTEDVSRAENAQYAKTCDAYYGDPSAMALAFYYEHKPIMIQKVL